MKKIFEYISLKTGLTSTELKTILFILIVFIFGWIAKNIKINIVSKNSREYVYNFQDSLFKAVEKNYIEGTATFKKKEKRVDSEVELSDFSNNKNDSKKNRKTLPEPKSINLNTATEQSLMRVPGIGPATANRIIKRRNDKGRFNTLNELIDVKMIGPKKLKKIKKYIYIEK